MAIIGKIRERSGLLVTMVGLGLVLFIFTPLFDGTIPWFSNQNANIGLFNNNEIDSKTWGYYQIENVASRNFPNANEDEIKFRAWYQMISDTIYNIELRKLGIGVTSSELNEGILNSQNPLPSQFKEQFVENGVFNQERFGEEVFELRKRLQNEPDPNYILNIKNNFEIPLQFDRKLAKYRSMLKYGLLGTVQEGKKLNFEDNAVANIDYIFVDYNHIPDSLAVITDEDRKNYFNSHRYEKKWKQENDVSVYDYVVIKFEPSQEDIEYYTSSMESLKTSFKNADDDSVFVAENAESPIFIESQYGPRPSGIFSDQPYRGGRFSSFIDIQIDEASEGDVIGPFVHQDKVNLVKIYETTEEEQAKVRHILITSKEGDEDDAANKRLADSILYAVKRDSSKFTELVQKYSDDPGSVPNGGVYSWFPKGQMVPEFENFSFEKRIGSTGVVRTNYGFHVIQVLGRKIGTQKKIAIVDESIMASSSTQDYFYDSIAVNFYMNADTAGLRAAADDYGYEVRSSGDVPLTYFKNNNFKYLKRTSQNNLYGPVDLNRKLFIAKWAFNSEIGDIMEPDFISHNQIVIAQLTEKIEGENDQFKNIKGLMEPSVINKKKADYFKTNTNISNSSNIDSIAESLGYALQTNSVKYSDINIGNNQNTLPEPKVIANIFNLTPKTISPIIEGKQGIYIVKLNSLSDASISSENVDEKSKKIESEYRNQVDQGYYSSLLRAYQVEDKRAENLV
ncbi:MAG: peptidylprolyl isomerase, partial [Bacteroidota bacterium]|nr:peptidylprolyl isomerase [Bacteroidota bacterium]